VWITHKVKKNLCARCGNPGKPRQLNDLLLFDKNEPVVVLCPQCVHLLRYADAKTWKWFRDYRSSSIT
jgi:RNase P subunit RPR2